MTERDRLSIGVVVPRLQNRGGAERLALRCARHWRERHEVTLYSRGFDLEFLRELGMDDVARDVLSPGVVPATRRLDAAAGRVLESAALPALWSREMGVHDVYVGHQWPTHRLDRHPLVWYPHEPLRGVYDLHRHRSDGAVGQMAQELISASSRDGRRAAALREEVLAEAVRRLDRQARPDRVVANSRFTAAAVERALGRRVDDVVYPGVDLPDLSDLRWDEDLFVAVGALRRHKRLHLAIEAVALAEGARLVIVGDGPERVHLERAVAALGVEDRVEIRADVDDAELRALYARALAGIFVPLREPFGMVALEVLAAGKPLVATDTGGFTERVDASCALLVPPEPAALAGSMRRLMADRDAARRMGAAGRKLVESWSWREAAAALEAIVVDAARRPRTGRGAAASPPARVPRVGAWYRVGYGQGLGEGLWLRVRRAVPRPDMPCAGFYASHHDTTLDRHLELLARAGVEWLGVVFRLEPAGLLPFELGAARHLLERVEERADGLALAPCLEVDACPRPAVEGALDVLEDTFLGHPAALRWRGVPVVLHDADVVARAAAGRAGLRAVRLPAAGAPVSADAGGPALARVVAGGAGVTRERLEAGLRDAASADWILLSSFNDFLAGDHFEPTVQDGGSRLSDLRAALKEMARPEGRATE